MVTGCTTLRLEDEFGEAIGSDFSRSRDCPGPSCRRLLRSLLDIVPLLFLTWPSVFKQTCILFIRAVAASCNTCFFFHPGQNTYINLGNWSRRHNTRVIYRLSSFLNLPVQFAWQDVQTAKPEVMTRDFQTRCLFLPHVIPTVTVMTDDWAGRGRRTGVPRSSERGGRPVTLTDVAVTQTARQFRESDRTDGETAGRLGNPDFSLLLLVICEIWCVITRPL